MKKILFFIVALVLCLQSVFPQKADRNQEKWVEKTLQKMTLREKIGQMMTLPLNANFTNVNSEKFAQMRRQIVENKVGGFTLFQGEANSIAALTNEAQKLSEIPLFFSADYERGLRMQSRTGTSFTTNMGIAATGDPQAAYRQGKIICEEMRAVGVNWLFAPVADINNNPDNPVINIRSFGADAKTVGQFVSSLATGVKQAGCLSTLKHFPGHGDTATDSHIGLSVVPLDRARLDAVEFVPFKMAIESGVDSVMTAHLVVPQVTNDQLPGTLNPKIINGILREDLKFKGIVSTDSMEMGAITKNFPNGESAVMAIKAGVDVVLFPPDPDKAINAVEAAIKRGDISEARINESVRRLLAAKYRLGLVQNRFVDPTKVSQLVEKPENIREANETAEKSITLLRNAKEMLPLSKEKANKTIFVVIAADDDPVEGAVLIPEITRRAARAKTFRLDPRSTKEEYAKVFTELQKAESIVLAPFVKRAALKGTVALPDNQTAFVKQVLALKNKEVAVIAFGSPYLLRQFPEAQVYAAAYAIEDVAQNAVARTLFGEASFRGKLPVRIPNLYEIGAGIVK